MLQSSKQTVKKGAPQQKAFVSTFGLEHRKEKKEKKKRKKGEKKKRKATKAVKALPTSIKEKDSLGRSTVSTDKGILAMTKNTLFILNALAITANTR